MTKSELINAIAVNGTKLRPLDEKKIEKAAENSVIIDTIAKRYGLFVEEMSESEKKSKTIEAYMAEIRHINNKIANSGLSLNEATQAMLASEVIEGDDENEIAALVSCRNEILAILNSGELTDHVAIWHGARFDENGYTLVLAGGRISKIY